MRLRRQKLFDAAIQGAFVEILAVDQAQVVPHRLLGEQAKAPKLDSGDGFGARTRSEQE